MGIVANTDFVGKYELNINQFNEDLIDAYILKYENYYLTQLLGASLSTLFIADLTAGVPSDADYLLIFNPLSYDFNNDTIISNGIKEMLIGFIYYNFIKDESQIQTSNGTVSPKGENSNKMMLNNITNSRFNDSVVTFEAIQKYIEDNRATYPTYNGQTVKLNYFFS